MTINAMRVSAGRALEVLRAGWTAQQDGHLTTAFMLHGRPGVGKSQIVAQLASEVGAELVDLRLTTIEPQDLRGLPYYDHEAGKTVWYRPEDLPDEDRPAILFLDELTAAAPWLQPTVYGLLQERRVGRHRLPPSVFLVAAGNRVEDGAVAHEMGTGLSDRLVHLVVEAEANDWLDGYAVPRGLHPTVIAFLKTRPDLLDTSERAQAAGDAIMATPRSWERISAILRAVPDGPVRRVLVAGTVGEAVAAEFALVAADIAASVQVAEMLAAPERARWALYPSTLHGLHALIYGLIAALDAATAPRVIDSLAGLRHLAAHRDEPVFRSLPLAELTTYGFETLIRRGLDLGLAEAFLDSPAYAAYAEERAALGLG
jgi:hypothetical protein